MSKRGQVCIPNATYQLSSADPAAIVQRNTLRTYEEDLSQYLAHDLHKDEEARREIKMSDSRSNRGI